MGLTATFSSPYFTGEVGGTSEVPYKWDASLGGRNYMIDRKIQEQGGWGHHSVRLMRQQSDQSGEPGEASVNPEDLWRRSQSSWHLGAGQTYLDRQESVRARFRRSKGIDVWTKWRMSLLPDTDQKRSSANTNLRLMSAGSRLYLIDGADCVYTEDVTVGSPTWNATTGEPGGALLDIASDGFNVWITDGSTVSASTTGGTVFSSFSTEDIDVLDYVKGRLMGAEDNEIFYNVSGTMTSLFIHANTGFQWVGFAGGSTHIYAAGFAGDKSLIYRIGLLADATALAAPIIAGELPDGEIVRSIEGYLGFIFLGTDKGVRFCTLDQQGALQIGALIPETSAPSVRCFEPQGPFMWFGWTNYDGTSTGLGRMDLRSFVDAGNNQLAYATDLMATAQGTVLSVATFQNIRVFTVSGQGVWGEDTVKVVSGTLDSGHITYDLPDHKTAMFLQVRYNAAEFAGTHYTYLSVDQSTTYTLIGTHPDTMADNTHDTFPCGSVQADCFEIRETLERDASVTTTGPVLTGHTLKSDPSTATAEIIVAPFIFHEYLRTANGTDEWFDIEFERSVITELRDAKLLITYQEGPSTYSVFVNDYDWVPMKFNDARSVIEGTLVVSLKRP